MGNAIHKGPPLPAVVQRERLRKRLEGVATPGIVVVSAQAAQGKSTLIADYLAAIGARACWIRLHPEDADPAVFFRRIRESCRPYGPVTGEAASFGPDPAPAGALAERIADLLQGLPPDLHLVFDNWHHLGSTPHVAVWLDTLRKACPGHGRLYVLSREKVAIHLQRKRIRHEALVMTGEELAFTQEEIKAFLATVIGAPLDKHYGRLVHTTTAGWVGALVLLAEAWHRRPDDPEKLLRPASLAHRLHVESADFFQEEIFGHQPQRMQHFLTLAALLETARADLMQNQLNPGEAEHLFREAARQNLFLQVLEDQAAAWRFRFNPLFRAFLITKGQTQLPRKTIGQFLGAAGRQCEAAGDEATAVTYFLKAGDTKAAAMGITKIGLQLSMEGRFAEIPSWLAMLPPALQKKDPWLAMLKAISFRIQGGQRTIQELVDVKDRFKSKAHLRERMLALAYLIETAVFTGYDVALYRPWIAEGEALLEKASQQRHFTYAKALLWQQIGFGAIAAGSADLQKGLSACQNAVILGKRIAAPRLVANALILAAQAHVQTGEFEEARKRLQAVDEGDGPAPFPEYGALHDLIRIHLELVEGRLDRAADLLERLAADIDAFGLMMLYPAYLEASGLLQIDRQQYDALEQTRQHMRDVAVLLNNSVYGARAAWLAALGGYRQGHFRGAQSLLRTALAMPGLPTADQARNRQLMGFIALNLGRLDTAAAHFERALADFQNVGMTLATCETQLGTALVAHARQNVIAAREGLAAAFRAMAERAYHHLPVIRPEDLARACVLCLELEIPAAVEHARHLLKTRFSGLQSSDSAPDPLPPPPAPCDPTGKRGRIPNSPRPPVLTISTFGGLEVRRDANQSLAAGHWQGSRPALLLKAILVHGSRHIPKDILIEALWPDHSPKKSLRNFKVTLHRLRKLLQPDMQPADGSAYIHLKDHLVSLDTHLCQVDTDAFHHLCKTVRRIAADADRETLQAWHREAERVYRGDFLPEEPYLPWAELKRATLKEEFIQLMYRLAQCLYQQEAFHEARRCYRRIVRIDPAQEKAQRRLMQMLAEDGRPGEAIRLYQEFRTYLQTEIGAAPDEATRRLYHSLRDPQPDLPAER